MSKEQFKKLMDEKAPEAEKAPSTLAKVLGQVKEIGGAIWDGAASHAEHGAAELASAIYTGNAYVPYGWSQADSEVEAPKTPEAAKEQEQDRGGRE